jgi:hypothetical protein
VLLLLDVRCEICILFHLVVLLLWWFFNFVAPTCSVVVVVLYGSVGDGDCGRGVEMVATHWLVVLHLVEVPMVILMLVFLWWYAARWYPRCWMHCGIGVLRFSGCRLWLVVVIDLFTFSSSWIFALYRWCEMM